MKAFFLLALLLAVVFASSDAIERHQFKHFKRDFSKHYANAAEEALAFKNFKASMKRLIELQRTNPLAAFAINEHADRVHRKTRPLPVAATTGARMPTKTNVPAVLDWRKLGAVTPVKNQGDCGRSDVFADVGNIEGANFVVNGKLVALSEEEVIVCSGDGCNGGELTSTYSWLLKHTNGSIATDASYPWRNATDTCHLKNITVGATITGYTVIPSNENTMTSYTAEYGPIAAGLDATALEMYVSGIVTNCPSESVDDAMAIVGYNNNNNPPYWILKNSWGTSWGMSGYVYIAKGSNQCGITSYPMTAFVKKN